MQCSCLVNSALGVGLKKKIIKIKKIKKKTKNVDLENADAKSKQTLYVFGICVYGVYIFAPPPPPLFFNPVQCLLHYS